MGCQRTGRRGVARLGLILGLLLLALPGGQALAAAAPQAVQAAVAERLRSGEDLPAPDRAGHDLDILRAFYDSRQGQPLWTGEGRPDPSAHQLLAVLADAGREGLVPRDYGVARIAALLERGDSPQALAELEILLTHGALNYARDLSVGRIEPSRADPELFITRPDPDARAILDRLAPGGDIAAALDRAPDRAEYRRLRDALAGMRAVADAGGWPAVPAGATLRPGDREPVRVPALRDRLAASGELPAAAAPPPEPDLFDSALEAAVRLFQARHGLAPDGVVGAGTLAALNVTAAERVEQLAMNMERWRWLPADPGPNYLLVNLAAFTLELFEDGVPTHAARVVVGTPAQRTPVFSDRMSYLEVNPTWTVPPSIARNEILPKLRKDPAYLAKNNYTLLSDWTENAQVLDARSIDWSKVSPGAFRWRIRQEPGDNNALGRIKFMFPNRFDVYLHDTPSRGLFQRTVRAFSHGCIRVEDPFALAEQVLRITGTSRWDRARLDAVRDSGKRQVIPLARALPIHLTYTTAFVDADGVVQFRPDIYGRDAKLAAALKRSRTVWPVRPDQG